MAIRSKSIIIDRRTGLALGALICSSFVAAALAGCASSTEYFSEGPGQPEDKVSGIPVGMVGVCKRPFSVRPPIVNAKLWEHARVCKSDTPRSHIRLGFGHETNEAAKRKVERMMEALKEGPKEQGGNTAVLGMLRSIRAEGESDSWLRDRVQRESSRTDPCDVSYLLNTMESESAKLKQGDRCAVYAYDQVARENACMFDTSVGEAVWLTGAWACVTRTGVTGKGESCHKLCAYDDYCARQVSCAAPDIDLALCALGVCLPEAELF